jgi:hypothetical protein
MVPQHAGDDALFVQVVEPRTDPADGLPHAPTWWQAPQP